MSSHQRSRSTGGGGGGNDAVVSTEAPETVPSNSEELDKVVVYLTQNSVHHHQDEVPETLAALKKADADGLGERKLLPISDPYKDGTTTYEGAFGEAAGDMTWWQDDESLKEGQLKIGEEVLTLGGSGEYGENLDPGAVSEDWRTAMQHVGVGEEKAQELIDAMFKDDEGNLQMNASSGGASNELLQLISVMNRADQGEFELDGVMLSGHHYSGTDYLFGEKPGHVYDMNDKLNMQDVEAVAGAFPEASSTVDQFGFSACNTYNLGMEDKEGEDLTTNQWIQGMFPNVQNTTYWEGIAPGSDMAAFFSGEYLLDGAREAAGQDGAMNDAKFRKTSKGKNIRSELNADGELEEVDIKAKGSSYVYNDYKGLRDSAGEAFTKRDDLMEYVYDPKKKPE